MRITHIVHTHTHTHTPTNLAFLLSEQLSPHISSIHQVRQLHGLTIGTSHCRASVGKDIWVLNKHFST